MNRFRIGSAVLLAIIALGGLLWVKFRTPDTWVTLDNASNAQVTVSINGKDIGSIAAHSSKRLENIATGKYQIVVKDHTGAVIESADYSVVAQGRGGNNSCYIYNLTGQGRYVLATVFYSSGTPPSPNERIVGKDTKFFQVNEAMGCQLDQSIPSTISSSRNSGTTSKTYLCHADEEGNLKCPGYY